MRAAPSLRTCSKAGTVSRLDSCSRWSDNPDADVTFLQALALYTVTHEVLYCEFDKMKLLPEHLVEDARYTPDDGTQNVMQIPSKNTQGYFCACVWVCACVRVLMYLRGLEQARSSGANRCHALAIVRDIPSRVGPTSALLAERCC